METDIRYNRIMEVLDRVGDRLDRVGKDMEEFRKEQAKTDKQIKDLNKVRGEYFMDRAEYTEMIMAPSVREMLLEEYGYQYFDRNLESTSLDNKSIQIDAIAWSNSERNELVIIEIKTKLKEKHIEDHKKRINYFDEYFPKFVGLKKIGMIVALEAKEELIKKVNDAGFYFASFKDDLTTMKNRKGFEPKFF
jgi:hypothetical protein